MSNSPLVVSTVGHSNLTVDALLGILRRAGIALVVDVRSAPYSQYAPQFNREPFSAFLLANGIGYRFAGESLGGRPDDPTCYKRGEAPADGQGKFLKLVDYAEVARRDWYQRGLERLITLARQQPTAILCSEGDPRRCHRHHLIAATLLDRGLAVRHLREQAEQDETLQPGSGPDADHTLVQQQRLF